MKRKVTWMVLLGVLPAALAGCATSGSDLVASGAVTLRHESPHRLSFPWIRVYQEDTAVIVRGSIRRAPSFDGHVSGLVGVHLIDRDGAQLAETETVFRPERIPINGARRSHFRARLDTPAAAGSTVYVDYHVRRGSCPGIRS